MRQLERPLHLVRFSIIAFFPLIAPIVWSAPSPFTEDERRRNEVGAGTLLIRDGDLFREAPGVSTEVAIEVTGIIARTHVRQRFTNPTAEWIEGVYVFPLPEHSAVDRLEMQIGERTIVGRVEERERAQASYQKAKKEGRKTSLVEQERPNVFTTSVANVGPGETVAITIAYSEPVRYDSGRLSLRFPMVVAPRFIPGGSAIEGFEGTGWATHESAVLDAARITPPVEHPASDWIHPVRIGVRIAGGFPLDRVSSPSHAIDVVLGDEGHHDVTLRDGAVPADRDFVLEWVPARGMAPTAALFRERREDAEYALLMVLPSSEQAAATSRLSRETIIVVDTSGSMAGASMAQARTAVLRALETLQPEDAFNVIAFDSQTQRLFATPRPATADAIASARRFVGLLAANGGTEMYAALDAALEPSAERRAVRQVIFVTDGAAGNEQALFALIARKLGRSRLYTVGIGSAPNSHFMTKAAAFGRGTFTYIADPSAVEREMANLFEKIERPVFHDLEIDWAGAAVEAWPARIPDVYTGEPVVVVARFEGGIDRAVLHGRRGDAPLSIEVPLRGGAEHPGIDKLWARRKVAAVMDSLHAGESIDEVSSRVAELGVQHQIVTRWSSLVALEQKPTAPLGLSGTSHRIPTHLPAGMVFDRIFGTQSAPVAPSPRSIPLTDLHVAKLGSFGLHGKAGRLPQGGTPQTLLLLLGGAALAASLGLHLSGRSRMPMEKAG